MIFRIPEEREFRLVVEGLYDERNERTLSLSLEIALKLLDLYSFANDCAYFDYSVGFKVIDRNEQFIQMSRVHYDPFKNFWLFSYHNIFNSEIESSDTIYDLFVSIDWVEEKNEHNSYNYVTVVKVWVRFRDLNEDFGSFL